MTIRSLYRECIKRSLMDDRDSWEDKIPLIEPLIGHRFDNRSLIKIALTHRSLLNEQNLCHDCNQRLEFLGDALLGAVVAEHLFEKHPELNEGALTKMRARIIDRYSCAEYALAMQVGPFLMRGKGEPGDLTISQLADLFEAIVGAVFLDSDYPTTRKLVLKHCKNRLLISLESEEGGNYKSSLQIAAHALCGNAPHYNQLGEEGPHHRRLFTVGVFLQSALIGAGSGSSKKQAEQRAAQNALIYLRNSDSQAQREH